MTRHLEREIERLKRALLSLSSLVEEALFRAAKAVAERDAALGLTIEGTDREIDAMEVEIEEECLKVLALHQPVATDLRFIIAVLKMNNDLERIGDLAVNLGNRAQSLARLPKAEAPFDVSGMAGKVQKMLHTALDALIKMDEKLAREVLASDDEIDRLHKQSYQQLSKLMKESPLNADAYVHYVSVSKNLERVADHATNIAEDVLYMISGSIVRHGYDSVE